jgi:hypothetical protein
LTIPELARWALKQGAGKSLKGNSMAYKKISQGTYNLNVASRDVEVEPPLPVKRDLSLAVSVAKERVEGMKGTK